MNINWLKLDVDILDNKKIKLIRKMPEGDALFTLLIAIFCDGMKSRTPGIIEFPGGMNPAEYFHTLYEIKLTTCKLGLDVFIKFKIVEFLQTGELNIVDFRNHQSIEKIEYTKELTRLRVSKSRAKGAKNNQKIKEIDKKIRELKNGFIDGSNGNVTVTPALRNGIEKTRIDKNREDKIRIDNKKENYAIVIIKDLIKNDDKFSMPSHLNTKEFKSLFIEWANYREHDKKIKLTKLSIKKQIKDFNKYTLKQIRDAIDTAISGNYQGLFPKHKNNGNSKQSFTNNLDVRNKLQQDLKESKSKELLK